MAEGSQTAVEDARSYKIRSSARDNGALNGLLILKGCRNVAFSERPRTGEESRLGASGLRSVPHARVPTVPQIPV